MANRGAGTGGGANGRGGDQRPVHDQENSVEFCVKPAEDLVLEGTHKTLLRVRANTPYSCIMMKTQRFASLFRHYAKHHGLDKEQLDFFFTEQLHPDDTPESVHMQRNDEIIVRRRKAPKPSAPLCPDATYFAQMKTLLFDDEHSDCAFLVGLGKEQVPAHRAVLTARSDYFRALFRRGGMKESEDGIVVVESCSVPTLRRCLEFLYTNRVDNLSSCTAADVIDLMGLAEQYLLTDLKALCQAAASSMLDTENVGKLLCAADRLGCDALRQQCVDYILNNEDVCTHPAFGKELQNNPSLALPIVKAAAATSATGNKRKRDAVA